MSNAILFKFRSSTNYENIPLPPSSSSMSLIDVKKFIVRAKNLDNNGSRRGGIGFDFDLSVVNALTGEEYTDDNGVFIPPGTRIIVQRVAASRGNGLLARMAAQQPGDGNNTTQSGTNGKQGESASQPFTLNDDEEEDEDVNEDEDDDEEENELAALKAVTGRSAAAGTAAGSSAYGRGAGAAANQFGQRRKIGGGPGGAAGGGAVPQRQHQQLSADPEIREKELKQQQANVKQRAIGIPRTFLSYVEQSNKDGEENNEGDEDQPDVKRPKIQANTTGFEELLKRGGGKSFGEGSSLKKRIKHALQVTNMSIPDNIKCAICKDIVQNAMTLPWDKQNRPVCEQCIRTALVNSNFVCPLTRQENVSPDDLVPNVELRKEAETFVQKVLDQMNEIDAEAQRLVEEGEKNQQTDEDGKKLDGQVDIIDGTRDSELVYARSKAKSKNATVIAATTKKDDFSDDVFGGDVFDVM